jgi:uncharacterized protein DUF2059
MKSRIALLILTWLTGSAALAGDAAKAKQLMTLMRADEVVAGAMKTGLRNNKTGINLSDAQLACLNAVPKSEFSDVVTAALAQGLSNEELAAAITFYRTPAGVRYVKSIVAITQGTRLDPPLTDAEGASVREFAATPAGDKLLKKALIPNSNVVADKMAQVSGDAIENCGKAPAK